MSHKVKAILFGSISIIIIGAIIIIALWPTSKSEGYDSAQSDKGDGGDGGMSDSSRLNLFNLHYRVTNHTIITTSTMVIIGCILFI